MMSSEPFRGPAEAALEAARREAEQSSTLITNEIVEKATRVYVYTELPSEMPVAQETREAMRAALEAVQDEVIERYCRRAGLAYRERRS